MPEPTRHLQPPGDPTADQPSAGATAGSTGEVTAAPGRTAGGPAGHPPPPIPGYELLEEIGRGGMGVVYRAKDLALGRDVAVKLLQDQYPADGIAARRFDREARITGGLQHPGVPAVYQAGALPGGRPFLAMKLIQGRTLDALIRDPAADRGRLVGAFEGVCQAVGCAHSRGVVHRDLKPANVMVGAFGEVQVMDWGLAKEPAGGDPPDDPPPAAPSWPWDELAGVAESTGSTVTGSVLGTPAFMPPEQARGETGAVGARADVFGLGAVLCAVLTGRPPYHGDAAG
ncbi:MAG: serine/threonine protein kinase, partial [Gemmataceae bacterium]|nr:serine/threonine protein kinase [Gemmataceae bacterium]